MNRITQLSAFIILVGALGSAWMRIHDESAHRVTALLADWGEVRAASARDASTSQQLLQALHDHGVQAIAVQPLTLEQLWQERRVTPVSELSGRDPLDTSTLRISDPALASLLYWEWTHRGVTRLLRPQKDAHSTDLLLKREGSTFLALKDLESAYDLDVLTAAKAIGLGLVFRLSQDPWLTSENTADYINDHPLLPYAQAILWNTETPLGGWASFEAWKTWAERHRIQTLLFEFKPPRSQRVMARALPQFAFRAHTIAINELREIRPEQEMARWRRAALERSCRFLLVHVSVDQSLADYLAHVSDVAQEIQKAGLTLGWPMPHSRWRPLPGLWVSFMLLIAFLVAAVGPLVGLYAMPKNTKPLHQFLAISAITLACALTAAALANFPETRLEVIPFRGVKIAFVIGWLGSAFFLFRPQEIAHFFMRGVRRLDLLLGVFVLAALAYVLLRTGNAGSGWTSSMEQPVRDTLEKWFVVRPRFKEFAFGHPLLLMGLMAMKRRSPLFDPRLLIFLGMAGQASMMNTFAHLHSPLALGLSRSLLGLGFGVMLGWVLNKIVLSLEKKANV